MRYVPEIAAAVSVLTASWLVLGAVGVPDAYVAVFAAAISAVSMVICLYAWQKGKLLHSPSLVSLGLFAAAAGGLLIASVYFDSIITGMNPWSLSNWVAMASGGGPFGFALTVGGAFIAVQVLLATSVRLLVTRVLPGAGIK